MDYDFYYADICIGLHIRADKKNALGELTSNQKLLLQNILYLALNTFILARVLNDTDDRQKGGG